MNDFYNLSDFIENQFIEESINKVDSPFEEAPVDFRTFNESPFYLYKSELSERQYKDCLAVLGNDPTQIFSANRQYTLATFLWGKGAGKDLVAARIMAYVTYVLLCYKDPSAYFFGNAGMNIDLINVAIKGDQAQEIFFSMLCTNIKESPWFKRHFKIYADNRLYSSPKHYKRGNIIRIGTNKITFPKKIRAFSETSDNESWEGYTPVMVLLDELSGFVTKAKILNGEKILSTAHSSVISRRTTTFCGFVIILSYPRQEEGDITLSQYTKSLMRDPKTNQPMFPHIYGSFGFSWHIKPEKYFADPVTGEIEYFIFRNKRVNRFMNKKDTDNIGVKVPMFYKNDASEPESFMTKYMCIPKRTVGGWLEYPERAYFAINPNIVPLFILQDYAHSIQNEHGTFDYLAKKIIACKEQDPYVRNQPHVLWLDNAEKHCDAVIGIGRLEKATRVIEGKESIVDVCRIVDIINWTPRPDLPISISNVEKFLVEEIRKYINVREVYSDGWQSAEIEEKLRRIGIKAGRYNLLGTQYDLLKYALYNNLVEIFDEEPYVDRTSQEQTSIEQIVSLLEGINGPDKRPGFKKDKADTVCGCVNLLLGAAYTKQNRPSVQRKGLARPQKVSNDSNFGSNLGINEKALQAPLPTTSSYSNSEAKELSLNRRYPGPLRGSK